MRWNLKTVKGAIHLFDSIPVQPPSQSKRMKKTPPAASRFPADDVKQSVSPPHENRHRIMIVDDHPITRMGLKELINSQSDLVVCCEADAPSSVFAKLSSGCPALALVDLSMPGRSGVEFIKDLAAFQRNLKILVLSMQDEVYYAERVLKAGARGYVMKSTGSDALLAAIRTVINGCMYFSPEISGRILSGFTANRPETSLSPVERLSDREFEVYRLLGMGKDTLAIATQLSISAKTVDVHRANIKKKLSVPTSSALICHAARWNYEHSSGA